MELARRWLALLMTGVAALGASGCSLHLHREADAKQARAAAEAYDKIAFDSVVKTARANTAELDKAEADAVLALTELVVRRDVAAIVTQTPDPGSLLPLGWAKLVSEIRGELVPLKILGSTGLGLTPTGDDTAKRLRNRVDNREFAVANRARLDLYVKDYKRPPSPGQQPTRCDYPRPTGEAARDQIRLPDQLPKDRPEGEPERRWGFYRRVLAPACQSLLADEEKADVHGVMINDEEYQDLSKEIDALEAKLAERDGEAKRLADAYAAAKTKLETAQAELAQRTVEKQTEKSTAELAGAQQKVKEAADGLAKAITEAKKVPLVEARIKTDLVAEVLSNFQALAGKKDAPAHEVTKRFLDLLQQYPDVAGRLRASDTPPVNVLLLELAIQRLAAQRLAAEQDKTADQVVLLRARRDLRVERTTAWVLVLDAMRAVTTTNQLERDPLVKVHGGADSTEQGRLDKVLSAYAYVRLKYDVADTRLALQAQQRERAFALEATEVSLTAWKDFIRAPLLEIAAYHEGGLRSEDLANLIHAIGLGGIAVGVNR